MAILSFKLDQLFIVLVPYLFDMVVVRMGAFSFPSEPDFVQESLSIKSKFVIVVNAPLRANPNPQRLVLLVSPWHQAMASLPFKLDNVFILLVPARVSVNCPSEPDFFQKCLSIKPNLVILMNGSLRTNPHP
jgi:hypothetical protein